MGDRILPATFFVGILAVEFLVHAWDLAEATGQKLDVDPALATYVLGLSKQIVADDTTGLSLTRSSWSFLRACSMRDLTVFTGASTISAISWQVCPKK